MALTWRVKKISTLSVPASLSCPAPVFATVISTTEPVPTDVQISSCTLDPADITDGGAIQAALDTVTLPGGDGIDWTL